MLNGKKILITGGTGSFGKKFVEIALKEYKLTKFIIFSRDEMKQFEMQQQVLQYGEKSYIDDIVRFFIGDVRDESRLYRALHGVDYVVHAAALKQVPAMEYNPVVAVNSYSGDAKTRFCVVRYGNVIGSRGSVIPFFKEKRKEGIIPITDKRM